MEPEIKPCLIVAIGEKSRQVSPQRSVAKIASDFCRRSNSPRPAYKIARCVAGLRCLILTDQPQSSWLSILNGTGRVQELSTFNFINHLKSLTSKQNNNKRTTNKKCWDMVTKVMKIWLDSRVILSRKGKIYLLVQICTTQTSLGVVEGEKFKLCQFRN